MGKGSAVAVGPFRVSGRGARVLLVATGAVWLTACAGGSQVRRGDPAAPPGQWIPPPGVAESTAVGLHVEALRAASEAVAMGDWERAAAIVDSVAPDSAYAAPIGLGDALALAPILSALGAEDRAARLLLESGGAASTQVGLDQLRRAAGGMSVEELEELERQASSLRAGPAATGVLRAELARAYALAGSTDRALALAGREEGDAFADRDRRTLDSVRAGQIEALRGPTRIGVVLSLTGRFGRVGEELLDGMRLAVLDHQTTAPPGETVELVIVDDESDGARPARLVEELDSAGVAAILGPIRSATLLDAARARSTAGLAIVSPTASRDSGTGPNAWSAWERERRQSAVGEALGRWYTERMGLYRLAALYPADPGGRAGFEAFEAAALERGGVIVGHEAYEPDSTTFGQQIRAVADADPEGVLVLAEDPSTVLQIAPQLPYFGLRSRIISGGAAWSDPEVIRRLEPAFADYRVVGLFIDREAEGTAWTRFVEAYESEYRRMAPSNQLAALAYDATRLVLQGMHRGTLGRPGAVSRRIVSSGGIDGATGRIRFDDAGRPAREVDVLMLRDGGLVEADPIELSTWAEEARAQEELMKELEEEEEKRKAAREAERQ